MRREIGAHKMYPLRLNKTCNGIATKTVQNIQLHPLGLIKSPAPQSKYYSYRLHLQVPLVLISVLNINYFR